MHIKCMSMQANLWLMHELNPLANITPTHKNLLHDKKQRKNKNQKKTKNRKKQKNKKNHGGAVLGKTWVVFFVFLFFWFFGLSLLALKKRKLMSR